MELNISNNIQESYFHFKFQINIIYTNHFHVESYKSLQWPFPFYREIFYVLFICNIIRIADVLLLEFVYFNTNMLINALFIYFIGEIVTATVNNENKSVRELEKEKNDLLKQINDAIDDSVKTLQKINDSDSLIGLKYMHDLKEHMKKVNETTMYINDADVKDSSEPYLENRRKIKKILEKKKLQDKRTSPRDVFDFEALLKPPKKMKPWKWKEIMETRQKMQKRIDEWILERQREKALLEKKRLERKRLKLSGAYEKCPRFGYQGRKKKKKSSKDKLDGLSECKICDSDKKNKTETTEEVPARKKIKESKKHKYPCCRKCCKKSYLGCL